VAQRGGRRARRCLHGHPDRLQRGPPARGGVRTSDRALPVPARIRLCRHVPVQPPWRVQRPYGGITYNRKPFTDRIAHLASAPVTERLAATTIACADFQDFLDGLDLGPDDLVFLDPPYDSDFSTYDRAGFGPDDHRRLAATIRRLPCSFQLVIRDTPLVRDLYLDDAWFVQAFDHTYSWTIKDRNDRAATHLLITNVDLDLAAAG
jgi:hypothetical protein